MTRARCKDCGDAPGPGRARCETHAQAHNKREAARRAERKRKRQCVTCGAPVGKRKRDGKPGTLCVKHEAYYEARAATTVG